MLQGWGSRSSGQRCTATQCQSTAKVISQRFFTSRNRYAQCCGSKYRYIEFWSGSRSGSRVILSILKEKIKKNFDEKYFLKTKYRYRYIFKEILTQLSLWIVNFHLKSYTFLPTFYPIYTVLVWIRFRIRNTDPDPDSPWIRLQYGSGSTTLVTVCIIFVVIWIREFNHADPDRIHSSTGTGVKLS